jgi:excisionase family DNA binding protein
LVSGPDGAAAGLERLLTVREVAKVLHVATSTVYQLCAEGKLAHVRVSNAIRIAPGVVAEYVHGRGDVSEG